MGKKRRTSKVAAKRTATSKRQKPTTGTARKTGAKSKASAKKTATRRSNSAAGRPAAEPAAAKPKTKSHLSKQELAEFQELLLTKRAQLVGDVRQLTDTALHGTEPGGAGNLSNMPIHPADVGSDNWEQEFTIDLIDNERQLLREIDAALARMEEGSYGICAATDKPITKKRLRAKPWARYCIEYARKKEQGLLP